MSIGERPRIGVIDAEELPYTLVPVSAVIVMPPGSPQSMVGSVVMTADTLIPSSLISRNVRLYELVQD